MERAGLAAVELGQGRAVDRPVDPGVVLGARGAAVHPLGAAVRAGPRVRPAGHPVRRADAGQRQLRPADAAAADVHAAVHVVGPGQVQGAGGLLLV